MTPTVVDTSRKGDVHEGTPLRSLRLFQKLHPGLMGKPISFTGIAGDAGTDNILPSCLSSAVSREHMIDIQAAAIEVNTAVLAGVLIAFKNIEACELNLLFGEAVEKAEDNDSRNPDPERDSLEHFWLRVQVGKIPPAHKIMGQEVA